MPRLVALALCLLATPALSEEVGRVGVDWTGNDIVIEAIPDPKVAGVTCHVACFDRSVLDRLSNGIWFEDPSNSSFACRQTWPLMLAAIDKSPRGEVVFSRTTSLPFKSLIVMRIFDQTNQVVIYLAQDNDLSQGSARMSISTVRLQRSVKN